MKTLSLKEILDEIKYVKETEDIDRLASWHNSGFINRNEEWVEYVSERTMERIMNAELFD